MLLGGWEYEFVPIYAWLVVWELVSLCIVSMLLSLYVMVSFGPSIYKKEHVCGNRPRV